VTDAVSPADQTLGVSDPRAAALQVAGLSVRFPRVYGDVTVLDDVDLEIAPGESVGLVGESGSGKSLLGLSIMGLVPRQAAVAGHVHVGGRDILAMRERTRRRLRGREIAMVYQDALTSLNPSLTVGRVLTEVCARGSVYSPRELLEMVSIRGGDRVLRSYPHELSGGQRQRVLIGLALARRPSLLVADEPTTALDVTVQAQIVELLATLQAEAGFSLLLVSHDLGLVSQVANRIAVMYAGQLVEVGPAAEIIDSPTHPYTRGLLDARRSLEERERTLRVIPGSVPSPRAFASGCRFRDRCPRAEDDCAGIPPAREPLSPQRLVACRHPLGGERW
jgi:oligopeptide/dipeptide ABC transporter ATP-binding protein